VFLSFFVNVEINTSEAIKICEKSYNRLLKYPSILLLTYKGDNSYNENSINIRHFVEFVTVLNLN